MKIKVELKSGITAELADYDAAIKFVSPEECGGVTISIDELIELVDVMKGASSMYRQEESVPNDDKLTEREELGLLREMVMESFKNVDTKRIKPDSGIRRLEKLRREYDAEREERAERRYSDMLDDDMRRGD